MQRGQGKILGEDNITPAAGRKGLGSQTTQYRQFTVPLVFSHMQFAMLWMKCCRRQTIFVISGNRPLFTPPSGPNWGFLSIEPLSSLGDMESSCVETPRIRKNTLT